MRTNLYVLLGFSLFVVSSCATSRPVSSGRTVPANSSNYTEDLAAVRPVYSPLPANSAFPATTKPVPVPTRTDVRKPVSSRPTGPVEALHINRRLDLVLDTIASKNRSVRYAPGFRVQVYVGNQRREADAAKLLVYQNFPELSPYLSYSQPTYKLKVGDFMRRLDAERYYASIRQFIASAQLQADKVDVRRSLLIK